MINERLLPRGIIILALIALGAGLAASFLERSSLANWIWIAGTAPVIAALFVICSVGTWGWTLSRSSRW